MRINFEPDTLLVCDGAMGTMIQNSGLPTEGAPERWNLEAPEVIGNIHKAYVDAGAQIVETNSFGGSPIKLKEYGLEERSYEICRAAASLARQAVGDKALVAGSVGPTGAMIEPMGTATFQELFAAFLVQIQGLADGGADLILIETMLELMEVKAALLAARAVAPGLPVICQMTFEENGMTVMGTDPETAAVALDAWGADMIGVNCSTGPDGLLPVIQRMSQVTNKPLTVQPNAGLPVMVKGVVHYRETPDHMASFVDLFAQEGVRIVGGCCGTTPDHIRALREKADHCRYQMPAHPPRTAFASRRKVLFAGDEDLSVCPLSGAGTEEIRFLTKWARARLKEGVQMLYVDLLGHETAYFQGLLLALKGPLDVPLVFSANVGSGLETALRLSTGKSTIYGMTLETPLDSWLLAFKYGANVVIRAADGTRQMTGKEKREDMEAAIEKALGTGIRPEQILLDLTRGEGGVHRPEEVRALEEFFGNSGYMQCVIRTGENSGETKRTAEPGKLVIMYPDSPEG